MKSWRMRIGALLAGGALAVLGVGAFAVAPAAAAAAHPAAASPPGVYNYNDGGVITEGGAATTLTINANGSFTLIYSSITDSGQWLLYGKTVALTVTNSEDGSSGCLLVGTVNHRGINSVAKPGPIDCNSQFGKTGTWYASVPHHVR